MNQQQAEAFVHDLLIGAWEQGRHDALEKFYDPKVIGHYRNTILGLAEIKNRMMYVNARYKKRKFHLSDITLIEPHIIAFRVRQTGIDTYYNKPLSTDVFGIYKIAKGVVKEVWLITEGTLDYLAKPSDLKTNQPPKEKFTLDEIDRKRFEENIKDYQHFYRSKIHPLTPREKECLYYFLNGYTAKEIARKLKLTHRTVQAYIASVKSKYDCSSKNELRQKIFPSNS